MVRTTQIKLFRYIFKLRKQAPVFLKKQAPNKLPDDSPDPVTVKPFEHLARRQVQTAFGCMLKLSRNHCGQFPTFRSLYPYLEVWPKVISRRAARCKRPKGLHEIVFITLVACIALNVCW